MDGAPFFVRIPGADTDLLAVDRGERAAQHPRRRRGGRRAARRPRLPEWDVFALEWIDGADDVERGAARRRDAGADRRGRCGSSTPARDSATTSTCSASPSGTSRSSTSAGSPIPAGYREHLAGSRASRRRSRPTRCRRVPCHNDLLAENYLDDGARLWIVDYEYSGNNDPTFELGNTAQELGFDERQVAELCAAYFGEASPALLARMRLQMIMSDVGWTLWAAIQARDLDDRLRLHGLGRGALGARERDARRPRLRGLDARRPGLESWPGRPSSLRATPSGRLDLERSFGRAPP